jgi:hypothetical protein
VVRFLAFLVVTLVVTALGAVMLRRPKSDRPATWAEAMAGATAVFAWFILAYGVVPHEWLTWADSDLGLREDKLLLDTNVVDFSGRALRDIVATVIYIVFLGVNIAGWVMWQKRGQAKPKPAAARSAPAGTSAYNRPVVKKD